MIVTCENCRRRYSIGEEMLRRKAVKLRCKGCQHLIALPAATSPPAPARPVGNGTAKNGAAWQGLSAVAAPVGTQPAWFVILTGRQSGPFGFKALQQRAKDGELNRRTYVWREGMADWKRAEELPELSGLFDPDRGGEEEHQAGHRRESFEPAQETATRPLSALKLSPQLVASAAQPLHAPEEPAADAARAPAASVAGDDHDGTAQASSAARRATPGEQTRFFIAEAGVHQRNPPWKIAAFVGSLIALPIAVLYLLAAFKVGPLVITRIDPAGNEIRESVFSGESGSGLADLLSGRRQHTRPLPDARSARPASRPAPSKPVEPAAQQAKPSPGPSELRAFYADEAKTDVGPVVRKASEREESGGGLAPAQVAKVVAQTQPAFQFCIEQEMKKNPSFKGGKVSVNVVIGSSGTVKQAAISRPDIDSSGLGECLKAKAKRMVFPTSSGDDVEVQIPLILTTSL